jgi:pimeloyl-ACP methyl ester carboxylesterase
MLRLLATVMLHLWAPPPDSIVYATAGTPQLPLRYARAGGLQAGRPTLLMIHGSPGDAMAFKALLGDTALQRAFNLVSVDRPGYGGTLPPVPERSLAMQAKRVAAVLPLLPQPVVVMGHSYGGPVALQLALDYPAQVQGLLIVAGSVDPDLEETKFIQKVARWPLVRNLIPNDLYVCNEEILALKNELLKMKPRLAAITQPVTVVQGLEDDLVPPANAAFLEKQLVKAALQVDRYPKLNHFIPFTQPQLVRNAALALLQRMRAATTR